MHAAGAQVKGFKQLRHGNGIAQGAHGGGKAVDHILFAVYQEYSSGLLGDLLEPLEHLISACVAGKAGDLHDIGVYDHLLAKHFDPLCPIHQQSAQGARCLIAGKDDGAIRPIEVMLQVVPNAACIAHARGGDDNITARLGIDLFALFSGLGDTQGRELKEIPFPGHL